MSGGGSSPQEPKPTASEIEQLRIAEADRAHYLQVYKPIEQQAIAEASTDARDAERSLMRGRSSADVALAEAEARNEAPALQLGSGAQVAAMDGLNEATADSAAKGLYAANRSAQDRHIEKQLNVAKTGRGKARDVHGGLRGQADREISRVLTDLNAEKTRQIGKAKAMGTLAKGAMRAGFIGYDKGWFDGDKNAFDPEQIPAGGTDLAPEPKTGLRGRLSHYGGMPA